MITALYFVLGAFALYGVIGFALWNSHHRDVRRSAQLFLEAWKNDTYTVVAKANWGENTATLQVSFPYGATEKYFTINQDGQLTSGIKWRGNDRDTVNASQQLRHLLEPVTEQIATMARLEGKFDLDRPFGTTGQAAP
jgi:hypothetical protein